MVKENTALQKVVSFGSRVNDGQESQPSEIGSLAGNDARKAARSVKVVCARTLAEDESSKPRGSMASGTRHGTML